MKLEVKNLEKKFKDFTAVNNVNFSINDGKTLGLLGPNGCGKTTTIGMLLGLIKPSKGEILIDGNNFEQLNREEILSKFNFASPYVELPKKLTVKENLWKPIQQAVVQKAFTEDLEINEHDQIYMVLHRWLVSKGFPCPPWPNKWDKS